jgi:hypothetical protein
LLSGAVPIVFCYLALQRAGGFADDVAPSRGPEDWARYKLYALSILQGDLALSIVDGPYVRPGGFLYIYFLAGVFKLLGENTSYVYVLQSAMLGLAIPLMYFTFGRYLSHLAGFTYLALLAISLYLDCYANYSFKLLSENLLVFLLPVFLLLALRGYESSSALLGAAAGGVLGMMLLTRPNLLAVALAVTVLWFGYAVRGGRQPLVIPALFFLAWCGTFSLMLLRNYAVTQQISLAVITDTRDWLAPRHSGIDRYLPAGLSSPPLQVLEYYGRRILFTVGFLPALEPDFRIRPHWIAAWLALLVYIAFRCWTRRPLLFWEAVACSYVALYLAPLVAVASISNYGFRMIVPVVPVVLVFACRLVDLARGSIGLTATNAIHRASVGHRLS